MYSDVAHLVRIGHYQNSCTAGKQLTEYAINRQKLSAFFRLAEGEPWLVVGSASIGLSTDQKLDLVEHMKTCARSNAPLTAKRLEDLIRRFY